jgi:hypothetical protein
VAGGQGCLQKVSAFTQEPDVDADGAFVCRYASLFFVASVSKDDNELITLEMIHLFVEVLDRYFGNVSESG